MVPSLRIRKVAVLAVMTALCVGLQLTPRPPNIEFTSIICFFTGFLYGPIFGISLGALTMFINGFLSPYGNAGVIMPFQVLGMALIGLAGGVYRRSLHSMPSPRWFSIEVAFLAAFLTFSYDMITNVAYAFLFDVDLAFAIVSGVPFTIIHIVSNIVLFGTTLLGLVKVTQNVTGEDVWSYQKEL